MTANKKNNKKSSAPYGLIAGAALALSPLLASFPSCAAENYFRSFAPATPPLLNLPSFGLSNPALGGETRIAAARPPTGGPATANYGETAGPQGRLRLRPANFGGM